MKFNQTSTWRGLTLIGSAVAAFLGYGDLFSASVSTDGVELGGIIGQTVSVLIPASIGVYETVRDEVKSAEKLLGSDNGNAISRRYNGRY
ncbi:hypothetical protein ACODM8_14435 [Vibrio ostreicida]|uniref:hypothetical protein n=1 Tax=Vibrio ostreicida TaxID=526588 RepID=UPI003B5AF0A8